MHYFPLHFNPAMPGFTINLNLVTQLMTQLHPFSVLGLKPQEIHWMSTPLKFQIEVYFWINRFLNGLLTPLGGNNVSLQMVFHEKRKDRKMCQVFFFFFSEFYI